MQALVQIFRARIVDVSPDQIMVEISGQERKIEAFIEAIRPYGIRELARTGRIALVRGDGFVEDDDSIELPPPTPPRWSATPACKILPFDLRFFMHSLRVRSGRDHPRWEGNC